jgi:hypothetical protein
MCIVLGVQIIKLMNEDVSKYPSMGMKGKLRDALRKMERRARNTFISGFLKSKDMQNAQPVRHPIHNLFLAAVVAELFICASNLPLLRLGSLCYSVNVRK